MLSAHRTASCADALGLEIVLHSVSHFLIYAIYSRIRREIVYVYEIVYKDCALIITSRCLQRVC